MGLLRNLVAEVNERGHLVSLLQGVNLTVNLQTEKETVLLFIENGKLDVKDYEAEDTDVIISGTKTTITNLLLGRTKLRNASENKEIQLKSSYRHSLFLESLFLLSIPSVEKETEISK